MSNLQKLLQPGDEVRAALDEGQPVLALESTIITHGMPWPRNLETVQQAGRAAREAGAVPATIAIVDGVLKAGLTPQELERLAKGHDTAAKCSRRDIPFLVHNGATAGTTVAATMIIAHMAGIRVFATGGIGGVHRGAGHSFDVSADLQELARTPVAVVCAGPKAILDIGLTLEYLETHGVPVIGYGTSELPAFYTRESGFGVDYRIDSATEIAATLSTQWALGLDGGAVIANPIPARHAMDHQVIEQQVATALRAAAEQNISGKALTPFLLQHIEELTAGASLDANVQLMLNNARLGGEIAVALAKQGAAQRVE
jgi:pseudouridine-5'-phosphate glycosidase